MVFWNTGLFLFTEDALINHFNKEIGIPCRLATPSEVEFLKKTFDEDTIRKVATKLHVGEIDGGVFRLNFNVIHIVRFTPPPILN